MPEYLIHGKNNEEGKTTAGGHVTPVSVSVMPAKLFMEARSLSYAPPKSIKPPASSHQRMIKIVKAMKDIAMASASRGGLLTLLFHSEPAGDPNEDQLFIGRLINSPLLVGGFSRSPQTIKGQNYAEEATLRQLAHKKSTVITGVRFRIVENENTAYANKVAGYIVNEASGLNHVRVRFATRHEDGTASFSDPDIDGEFHWDMAGNTAEYIPSNPSDAFQTVKFSLNNGRQETLIHDGGEVGYTTPPLPLPEPQEIWRLPNPIPEKTLNAPPGFPEERQNGWVETFPLEEDDFNDFIIVDPWGEVPAIYVYFQKRIVNFLEVDYYGKLKKLSKGGIYEVDHIPSKAAVEIYLTNLDETMTETQLDIALDNVASVAIPKSVHQKCSETYGGRNNSWLELDDDTKLRRKEYDGQDLKKAVERNWEIERRCLKAEYNTPDEELDKVLAELHRLNRAKGLYQ
ncbi:S-type pyocin domain-containing protein [Proteus vulgaris]|uniref:S-type pyocin domain-containing protein n=1 Tax=Proteus vulgaris TaxID=585 RepID=UPI0021B0B9B9|nr:S-type pyocin domain-containing protein [Proteus vulgaris]MCT6519277.1 S-type pyocin domain-containing protein [Proteus vulgaris]